MSDAVLVYDDDCGFCTWWARFFAARSDLELIGFSELEEPLLSRLPSDYTKCSHVVADGEIYSCGKSMEEALRRSTVGIPFRPAIWVFRRVPPYNWCREWFYRRAAGNRVLLGKVFSTTPPAREGDSNGRC